MDNANMFDLSGKVALVVGGRGYLGRGFCQTLLNYGADVISADLPELSKAAKKSTRRDADDDRVMQVNVEVGSSESVQAMVASVLASKSSIDILIYSVTAKPEDFYAPYTECSLAGWQSVIRAELDGLFLVTQAVGRVMEAQQSGSMLFLSSIYGVVGNDQRIYEGANLSQLYADTDTKQKQIYSHAVYPAVKGGVIALTRYLAAYWGEKNIRVNCISPGGVAHEGENDAFVKKYSAKVPLGRKADVSEISGAVVYLCSDAASYVTGQNLIVDGGWTAW